ncbi:DciA family protein [Streptomyces tibetensis]|uniref:DciA family protein n=1 Tax=Streptomyces tibetensis TaxID=2382123 RepID=A0ABW6N8C2_9ACTN
MTDTQPASGVDLARAALAAAKAAAKDRPTQPQKKTRRGAGTSVRRTGDPMGLGSAITRMMTERGWQPPETGGSILDQWPTIAPELADKVHAVRYEHDTGVLHLKPVSDAYATQLRLYQAQILTKVQQATAGASVRALKVLPVGGAIEQTAPRIEDPDPQPTVQAPVRTRETASAGYKVSLCAALAHRPERQVADPYLREALERQEAALRAKRLPEDEHRDAYWEVDRLKSAEVDRSEAVRRAAIARARQERAGGDVPRRLFGAA